MKQQLQIKVSGIVQGVYFRKRIEGFAKLLGIKGFVKNQRDGSVLIIAQGRESALEELLTWCQKEPFPVKINGMSYKWEEIDKIYNDFIVIKDRSFFKDQAMGFLNLGREVVNLKETKAKVPTHVVIIPDGNRRWAREKGWHPWIGHRKAVEYERMKGLFNESKEIGVKYLTFWAFSTENWARDRKEIKEIFKLIRKGANDLRNEFIKENIRFRHMGRKDRLPGDVIKIINDIEEETKEFDHLFFQLCLDYNGRDDIVRAFKKMKENKVEDVSEKIISNYLDSNGIPDPDLIIRTSGEKRTSGIMAYQAAYAELYFTNVYFPDFDADQFKRAILDYSARIRRFGGTVKKEEKKDLTDPDPKLIGQDKNLAI